MPRLKIDDKESKKKSMRSWIKSQLNENGITQTQMAIRMNLPVRTFKWKLKEMNFTYSDLITMFTTFDTDEKELSRRMKM